MPTVAPVEFVYCMPDKIAPGHIVEDVPRAMLANVVVVQERAVALIEQIILPVLLTTISKPTMPTPVYPAEPVNVRW